MRAKRVYVVERRNRGPSGKWTAWFVTYSSFANPFRDAAVSEREECKKAAEREGDENTEFRIRPYTRAEAE